MEENFKMKNELNKLDFSHCQTCNKSSSNKVSEQFSCIGVDSVSNGINAVDS